MVDVTPSSIRGYETVAQVAERLGITENEVRRLIKSGQLAASKPGSSWLVEERAVEERLARGGVAGRVFSPANAWALLYLADDRPAPFVDRRTRYRLRAFLAHNSLVALRPKLRARAERRRYRAHPSLLDAIRNNPALMLTGISAAGERGYGLIGGADDIEGYVSERDLPLLVRRHHLATSADPNVLLRVVPFFGIPWPTERVAPMPAIALDLMEHDEPRVRQVGSDMLSRLGR